MMEKTWEIREKELREAIAQEIESWDVFEWCYSSTENEIKNARVVQEKAARIARGQI